VGHAAHTAYSNKQLTLRALPTLLPQVTAELTAELGVPQAAAVTCVKPSKNQLTLLCLPCCCCCFCR
jgi:hypothetical protein